MLKLLSTEVGTVFYVTEQFETGTYLAANVMAVRKGDLAGGVAQTILHRVYYITKQLNPKAGQTIRELVKEELKKKYTAEAYKAAVEQIRKEMAVNGNDVSSATAEEELCAREFPSIIMEGAAMEKLAAADKDAVNLIRKSLRAVQEHLSDEVTLSAVKGKVTFDGVDQSKLNERQRATVKALSVGFGAMGINVEFFESPVNQEGEHVGINGSYDPATNTVRLDIAAGIKGEDAILFTASHELTHFIKEWSEDKYQAFVDFLLEKYAEHGVDVESLIQAKIEASKKSSAYTEPLSRDAALEEVICDSCETFLRDSNLMESLTELAKKDQTLFERVKEFFANLLEDLRRVYRGLMPDSAEANIVLEMTDCLEELHAMWEDAALSASGNFLQGEAYQASGNVKYQGKYNVDENPLDKYNGIKISSKERWRINDALNERLRHDMEFPQYVFISIYNLKLDIDNQYCVRWWGFDSFEVISKGGKKLDEIRRLYDEYKQKGQAVLSDGRNGKSEYIRRRYSGDVVNAKKRNSDRRTDTVYREYTGFDEGKSSEGFDYSDERVGNTNDLYNRLTALVRGEEVATAEGVEREADFDIDAYADREFTYSDAEQVRAENDGAASARNFEDMTPAEQAAEIADLQSEIDPFMTLENKNIFAVFKDGEFWEMEVTNELWEAVQALDNEKVSDNIVLTAMRWNVDKKL